MTKKIVLGVPKVLSEGVNKNLWKTNVIGVSTTKRLFSIIFILIFLKLFFSSKNVSRYGTIVTRYGAIVTRYGAIVSRYGAIVTRYGAIVTRYGAIVTRYGAIVTRYGAIVS